jgi:hypothetical protein
MSPPTLAVDNVNRVELSLAANAEMLFLARMTGAAVASRAEFDYERIEDLRLAIDELCVRLMRAGSAQARITLLFQWDEDGAMEVIGTQVPEPANNGRDPSMNESHQAQSMVTLAAFDLSERILDALVDEHGEDTIGGVHRAWLRMSRRDPLG